MPARTNSCRSASKGSKTDPWRMGTSLIKAKISSSGHSQRVALPARIACNCSSTRLTVNRSRPIACRATTAVEAWPNEQARTLYPISHMRSSSIRASSVNRLPHSELWTVTESAGGTGRRRSLRTSEQNCLSAGYNAARSADMFFVIKLPRCRVTLDHSPRRHGRPISASNCAVVDCRIDHAPCS